MLKIEKDIVGFYISGHPLDQYRFELRHFCNANLGQFSDLAALQGREIRIGGIVSGVAHRISKNGKPYGILTLEDYDGSHTFYLFSEDYLRHKQYFEQDWFLYLRGTVVPQRWRDNELEFKISDIDLLGEVKDKYFDGVALDLQVKDITERLIDQLDHLTRSHPGKGSLIINILDDQENVKVDLFSRKVRLGMETELFLELERIPGLEYRVLSH